jgi:hypothetical protein
MGLLRAFKPFEVPKSTLKDEVKSKDHNIDKFVNLRIDRKPVLPKALENALVSYCLTIKNLCSYYKRIASQLAFKNGIRQPFSGKDKNLDKNGFINLCKDTLS